MPGCRVIRKGTVPSYPEATGERVAAAVIMLTRRRKQPEAQPVAGSVEGARAAAVAEGPSIGPGHNRQRQPVEPACSSQGKEEPLPLHTGTVSESWVESVPESPGHAGGRYVTDCRMSLNQKSTQSCHVPKMCRLCDA